MQSAHRKQATDHADVVRPLRESVSTLEGLLMESRRGSEGLSNELLVAPLRRCLQLAPRAHWPTLKCAGEPGQRSHGLGRAKERSRGKRGTAVGRGSTSRGGSVVDASLWLCATTVRLRCAGSGPRSLLPRGEPRGADEGLAGAGPRFQSGSAPRRASNPAHDGWQIEAQAAAHSELVTKYPVFLIDRISRASALPSPAADSDSRLLWCAG